MAPSSASATGGAVKLAESFGFAVQCHQQGRLPEAATLYRQVLCLDCTHSDAFNLLGIIAHQTGHSAAAVALLSRAITIRGHIAAYRSNLANVLKDVGRPFDAVIHCRAALIIAPGNIEAHYNLGNILTDLGRASEAIGHYRAAARIRPNFPELLANFAIALTDVGQITPAAAACRAALCLKPDHAEAYASLANLQQQSGRVDASHAAYDIALRLKRDQPRYESNYLMNLYYRSATSDAAILQRTAQYGDRIEARVAPPVLAHPQSARRSLRIGYVSGDFRRHPVGYFLSPVLAHHDPAAVEIFCYSNNPLRDEMTDRLQANTSHWRNLAGLSDQAAADLIARDKIDILIDLSGHTALNRLPVFARKPAPIQLSWLGFWGSTGLSRMDYILTDGVMVRPSEESLYREKLLRLTGCRFCYEPPDYAPPPASPPARRQGFVTFGSFNNLAKLNAEILGHWADILLAVPRSRLLLKWKSLADREMVRLVSEHFAKRGVAPERVQLRGASPHPVMLAEYGDIDIALDPFPFSGGLTSCEALWMGVPVITMAGDRASSRQTESVLRALGHEEWVAASKADQVRLAAELAADPARLERIRQNLRHEMAASPLCDGAGFTRRLETIFRQIWQSYSQSAPVTSPLSFLHVGCGHAKKSQTTSAFAGPDWRELRLDINPAVNPDLVGTMTDMTAVPSESVDALFSSHNIEHLYPHEVPVALKEFLRVLRPSGFAVITCPDLQSLAQLIVEDKLNEPAYSSPAGPITPLDILYGHLRALAAGNLYMAHRCGFTKRSLDLALTSAGFEIVASLARGKPLYDLWVVASKSKRSEEEMRALAQAHFPKRRRST